MKRCSNKTCKEEKELTEFYKNCTAKDGFRPHCKSCVSAQQKKYKENNPEKVRASKRKYRENSRESIRAKQQKYNEKNREKIRAQQRKYRENNKEKIMATQRKYAEKNRESIRASQQKWKKKKRATCPMFRMVHCLRERLRAVLRGKNKSASTMALLDCTVEELKKHLEKQFVEGMSWDNRGTVWHIDHMVPCASFDLSDAEQQRRCFHFTNLQPLFASENIIKGNRNIYGPYMKWEGDQWYININGEYMSRSRQVEERIPTQYFYPIKWLLLRYREGRSVPA
jgi:hypothetical protein